MNFDDPEIRNQAFKRRMDAMHAEMMKKYGWYAHYVPGDNSSPTEFNAHTHGFEESWNHPDIQIVVYMPQQTIHGIMTTIANAVKEGTAFQPGRTYDNVLQGYDVMFAGAQEGGRRVLRVILPDPQNNVARGDISAPYAVQWEGAEE